MDEEAVKPCIQDRLHSFIISEKEEHGFTIIILILILFMAMLLFLTPDCVVNNPVFKTRIEFLLSITLGLFAFGQMYSTYLQRKDNINRNKIFDLNNELEKVYGPLATLLTLYKEYQLLTDEPFMSISDASKLNEIFSKYPYILSNKLYDFWKEEINIQTPRVSEEPGYLISDKFIEDFFYEYDEKLKIYRKLLE